MTHADHQLDYWATEHEQARRVARLGHPRFHEPQCWCATHVAGLYARAVRLLGNAGLAAERGERGWARNQL